MTKKEAKALIKGDLYGALYVLVSDDNAREIIERVLDNIDAKTLQKAINKGTR